MKSRINKILKLVLGYGFITLCIGLLIITIIVNPKFFIAALLAVILLVICYKLYGAYLKYRWEIKEASKGKRVLLIYSRSPNWQDYIESNWIKQLEPYLVVLDWSNRSQWTKPYPLEVKVFHYWGGIREHNPIAILFPKRGKVQVIRFWQAFRDSRHLKTVKLQKLEEQLFSFVNGIKSTAA